MDKRKMIILFASITIAMLGYGLALPILPFYLEKFGGSGVHLGLLIASYGVMQLMFAPFWGRMSDRYGRKPILIIGMMGLCLAMILFGLSTKLWMLYVAQMISGVLTCAMIPVSMAYTSDISTTENRSSAIGKIGAAIGLGMILGPGLGGVLARNSLSTPFFIAIIIALLTILIIIGFLPESLPKESRESVSKSSEKLEIKEIFQALLSPIGFGLFTVFAVNFGKSNFTSIYSLYAYERFGFGVSEIGGLLMIMSLMYLIAQGVLVGPLTKKFGTEKIIRLALLGNAIGFILMIFAANHLTMIFSISFFTLVNSLLKPAGLSFISQNAIGSQGMAMGIAESYMSLGRIIGPLWAGAIFDVNILFPYVSGATFYIIMFAISITTLRNIKSFKKLKDEKLA